MWVLGIEHNPLEEQPILLTTELTLQPQELFLIMFYIYFNLLLIMFLRVGARSGQKLWVPLELDLQAVVSHPT